MTCRKALGSNCTIGLEHHEYVVRSRTTLVNPNDANIIAPLVAVVIAVIGTAPIRGDARPAVI